MQDRQSDPRRALRDGGIIIPAIAADGTLHPVEKLDAHRRGLLHVAISVFVRDGARVLLQRRALGKYHCGGLWANTCCTHPHFGERPADAAPRRLVEELGIALELAPRGVVEYRAEVGNGLVEHERVHLFLGRAAARGLALAPDPDEVMETRWTTLAELDREVAARPERFTPWMRIYLARHAGLIFDLAA